ncbi:MAG TPA: hypothetical protein VF708_19790 [Pyrinomonadaceae bacterium]|jgi:hypothetical protein
MAVIKVSLPGAGSKSFTVPDEYFKGRSREESEKIVKKALAGKVPNIDNAEFDIPENREAGAPLVIGVTERATTKGSERTSYQERVLARLIAAYAHTSPAVALAREAQRAESEGDDGFVERATRQGAVERAISESEREMRDVDQALGSLARAVPQPSTQAPEGF